ncbi:hypothetical protein CVH13_00285 [Dehalococcoides mccartyi]|uniref:Uncharacterized protein n=1 Tax=Dehalococcoides mccartyi TaxID=61435 RepID=A0A2J1DZY6_9CHLR|nr:hypothetical protein CVH13_00285 [Dehalococcoides mccartyi]
MISLNHVLLTCPEFKFSHVLYSILLIIYDLVNQVFGYASPSYQGLDLSEIAKTFNSIVDICGKLGLITSISTGLIIFAKIISEFISGIKNGLDDIFGNHRRR